MQVNNTSFTVAEYCDQMRSGKITINRDYQRTSKVWPPTARSYLIDTILQGYPIPKISLYQKTDLKSRKTVKEIVDGQQRSTAILDFYEDKLRITGRSDFAGKTYSDLDEDEQKTFVGYSLSADVFVTADDDEIRQTFRRINSVPLNPEEQRHATHQGAFKWFVIEITEAYAPTLIKLGVFSERNLSRMQDAKLFTEVILAAERGIGTFSKKKLDDFYAQHEEEFPHRDAVRKQLDSAFERILTWQDIHDSPLMKPFCFYSLLLATMHYATPIDALWSEYEVAAQGKDEVVLANLGALASALEQNGSSPSTREFVEACSAATNTEKHRKIRFRHLCRALGPELLS